MKKIICSKCGSEYELNSIKIPARDKDSIECHVCGIEIFSWNEAKMWIAKLIKKQENHKINL